MFQLKFKTTVVFHSQVKWGIVSNNRSSIRFLLFVAVVINKLFGGKYPQLFKLMTSCGKMPRIKVLNEIKYSGGSKVQIKVHFSKYHLYTVYIFQAIFRSTYTTEADMGHLGGGGYYHIKGACENLSCFLVFFVHRIP